MSETFNPESKPLDPLADLFGETIYSYTRAQAIEDGVLIDVSDMAREAGFVWPVALTSAAWADCVQWSAGDTDRQTHQDQSGRLWDVLFMAMLAIKEARGSGGTQLLYTVMRVPRDGRAQGADSATLKLVTGPGDDGKPVITIMLPNED